MATACTRRSPNVNGSQHVSHPLYVLPILLSAKSLTFHALFYISAFIVHTLYRGTTSDAVPLPVTLPVTLLFDYPSVSAVVDYLAPLDADAHTHDQSVHAPLMAVVANVRSPMHAEPTTTIAVAYASRHGASRHEGASKECMQTAEDVVVAIPSARWDVDGAAGSSVSPAAPST
eukprot:9218137-Pyramimonas_sp.AAC.1